MNTSRFKNPIICSAVAVVAICAAASAHAAPVTVFDEDVQNGWFLPGAPASELSSERAHTGTVSVLSTSKPDYAQLIFDRSGTLDIGDNTLLSAYLYFDTSAGPLTSLFQVKFYFPDTAVEVRPSNSNTFVNGVQDSEGQINFPANSWTHLQVDLTSNAQLMSAISLHGGVPRFDFQYHDESNPQQNSLKLFADDVQFTAVPEPGSALLLGLMGTIAATRPRRAKSARV